MSRLDIRCRVNLPANVSMHSQSGAVAWEKARFSSLSLGGGLLETGTSHPGGSVVDIECMLPRHGTLKMTGQVLRREAGGIAVRFLPVKRENKAKLWNYLRTHISDLTTCPFCRSKILENQNECATCGMSLEFDSPRYVSIHEKWSFIKRLAMKSEFLSVDDISRINDFIDRDILGIGKRDESGLSSTVRGSRDDEVFRRAYGELAKTSSLKKAKSIIEKQKLIETLQMYRNNISQVAKALQVSRPSVYAMKKKYHV